MIRRLSLGRRLWGALGLASAAAISWVTSAAAYRTAGDLPEFEGTETVRWADGTVRYWIHDDLPSGVIFDDVVEGLHDAFTSWSEPICSQASFIQSGLSQTQAAFDDGINTVQWIHFGWAERGYPTGAAAVSDVQYAKVEGTWAIVEADLYINSDTVDWSYSGEEVEGKQDFHTVMVHEGGHLLGLLHPCEESPIDGDAPLCSNGTFLVTMHPEYAIERSELSQDDVDGICFLYPGNSCQNEGCRPGYTCTARGCELACGNGTCASGEECVAAECVAIEAECPECEPCESASECIGGAECIEGVCINGSALEGDPCLQPGECASGTCTSDGYCSTSCLEDEICGDRALCVEEVCESERAPFGATCAEAADCMANVCIADLTPTPVCSRACGSNDAECPLGWECGRVDGAVVCRPPADARGCACGVAAGRSPSPGSIFYLCLLGLGSGIYLRRRFTVI